MLTTYLLTYLTQVDAIRDYDMSVCVTLCVPFVIQEDTAVIFCKLTAKSIQLWEIIIECVVHVF